MPEIEFLSDDASPQRADDLAPPAGRRRLPRWAKLVGLAAAVGLVVAAALSRPDSGHPRSAATTPTDAHLGPHPGPIAPPATVQDLAIVDGTTWQLYPDRLAAPGRVLELLGQLDPNSSPTLVPDPAHGVLWIVAETSGPGMALEFDAHTLRQLRRYVLGTIAGAAVLDGRLYVVSGPYLVALGGTKPPRTVAVSPSTAFAGIAADPARDRLVVVDSEGPAHLWTYRPGGALDPIPVRLPVANGSLAVIGGQIWVGAYEGGGGGAVLLHVTEPANGRPARVGEVGPDALMAGTGAGVVWVRGADPGSNALWCVDARTGRTLQRWDVEGQVASTTGLAEVATEDGLRRLALRGCPG